MQARRLKTPKRVVLHRFINLLLGIGEQIFRGLRQTSLDALPGDCIDVNLTRRGFGNEIIEHESSQSLPFPRRYAVQFTMFPEDDVLLGVFRT